MPATIRAVAYFRKSTEDDGESISQQKEWADQQAEQDGAVILREFKDQAIAGWDTAKRTDFHAMLEYCQEQAKLKNPIDAIYFWHTNRFSRSDSFETGSFLNDFRKAGVRKLRTRERWIDLRRKEDRVLLNLEQDLTNNDYVMNLAADSLRGRIKAASEGRRCGGTPPYGYRAEKEEVTGKRGKRRWRTKCLILGPEHEIAVVRRIFEEYATGEKGLRLIANGLNADGIPSPSGKLWAHTVVQDVLKDPAYIGRNAYGRRRVGEFFTVIKSKVEAAETTKRTKFVQQNEWTIKDGCHDPIISVDLFHRVQAVMTRRSGPRGPSRGDFPLTGLLRCGHCGYTMSGRNVVNKQHSRVRTYRRYECQGYQQNGPARCQYSAIDADALANALIDKLLPDWLTPGNVKKLREEIGRQDEAAQKADPDKLKALRRIVDQAEGEINRATDELLQTDKPAQIDRLRKRINQLSNKQEKAQTELKALEATQPDRNAEAEIDAAMAKVERLRKAKTANDRGEQRSILHEAVARIEVFFERRQCGKRNRSRFAKALVYLVPDVNIVYRTVSNHHS